MTRNPPYSVQTADHASGGLSWEEAIALVSDLYDPAEPVPEVFDCKRSALEQSEVVDHLIRYRAEQSRSKD